MVRTTRGEWCAPFGVSGAHHLGQVVPTIWGKWCPPFAPTLSREAINQFDFMIFCTYFETNRNNDDQFFMAGQPPGPGRGCWQAPQNMLFIVVSSCFELLKIRADNTGKAQDANRGSGASGEPRNTRAASRQPPRHFEDLEHFEHISGK